MLTYHRYNAIFTADWFKKAGLDVGETVDAAYLADMQEMDRPQNLDRLARLGAAVAEKQVDVAHFPEAFDAGVRVG